MRELRPLIEGDCYVALKIYDDIFKVKPFITARSHWPHTYALVLPPPPQLPVLASFGVSSFAPENTDTDKRSASSPGARGVFKRSEDLHPRIRQPRIAVSDCDGVGEWRETERVDLFKKI